MPALIHKSFKTGAAELNREGIKYRVVGSDGTPYNTALYPPDWGITIDDQSIPWNQEVPADAIVELKISAVEKDARAKAAETEAAYSAAQASASAAAKAEQDKQAAEAKAKADQLAAAEKAKSERTVSYVVEADGPIGVITYTNWIDNQMGQEQAADMYGPVTKDYKFKASSFESRYGIWSLGVSAQAGAGTSSITCRILMDGREIAKQTSTGPYSIVMCQKGG